NIDCIRVKVLVNGGLGNSSTAKQKALVRYILSTQGVLRMLFRAKQLTLFAFLLALGAGSIYGQTLYGSLTGNVTDGTGAAIAGAKVEVVNMGTGQAKSDLTDERGVYIFSDLLPGTYKITISAPAFGSR